MKHLRMLNFQSGAALVLMVMMLAWQVVRWLFGEFLRQRLGLKVEMPDGYLLFIAISVNLGIQSLLYWLYMIHTALEKLTPKK